MRRGLCAAWLFLLAPSVGWAQDTDEFTFEEEDDSFFDEETAEPEPAEEEEASEEAPAEDEGTPPPDDAPFEEDEVLVFEDEVTEDGDLVEDDLFEDEEDTTQEVLAPGTDTVTVYRAKEAELADVAPDEEVLAWEAYLQEYPNSVFRERIAARIDTLMKAQFDDRISRSGGETDAGRAEMLFVQPMHMTNVNPRTKVQAAFEFGFPGYFGGLVDFEYAPLRNVSVHGGLTGRYSGWGLEFGARYAPVKSVKTGTVFSIIADVRVNFAPLFFQVRPQLALGQMIGPVQILASFGTEIGTRRRESVGLIGGMHVSGRVAEPVSVFAEVDFNVRQLGRDEGPFAFAIVSFGFKFFPKLKKRPEGDPLEIGAGGHVPVAQQYSSYYLGGIQAQGTYYLDMPYVGGRRRK